MEPESISAFLHEHMRAVYGYCLRRSSCPQDAEDAAQEILLRTHAALLQRRDVADPLRYLWTIARNTLASAYRAGARCIIGIPPEQADDADILSDLLTREETRLLHRELTRLTRQQREIIALHYFHGMKQVEIASTLDLPVGTVKWHLYEAKKELKQNMTHPQQTAHLKFDPIRFSAFGSEGSIGPDGSPWRAFSSAFRQNIAYACWRKGRTAVEIADCLGVSPVFIEDEAERLAEQGYLITEGGKYRCAILLTEWTADLLRLTDTMYREASALIAPALAEALSPEALATEGVILPESSRRSYALWALIPWMISTLSGGSISFQEVATLRPDGAQNLCHAAITPPGVPQPALAGKMERFSGPCWNGCGGMTLWQIDTIWTDERIGEMYQVTEAQILRLLRRLLITGDTLSKEEYSLLVQRGILRREHVSDGSVRQTFTAVWLQGRSAQERLLSLGRSVYDAHQAALSALLAPCSKALMEDTPPHLRRLREYLLQGVFHADRFILHCLDHLVNSGVLLPPTEDEKPSLHTLLLTE